MRYALLALLVGCSIPSATLVTADVDAPIGGTISGLVGHGLVLQDLGGDDLTVSSDGSFAFATPLVTGSSYSVTVETQPTAPNQTCTVTNGSGVVADATITGIVVSCTTDTFTVSGTVTGLVGSGLVLQNNGVDALPVAADGTFVFATGIASGATYDVTVATQPAAPAQTCTVAGPAGTVGAANVDTVTVTCKTGVYAVGGVVSSLAGAGLVLENNTGDDLAIAANGAFTFATPVASGHPYAVTVRVQPTGPSQTCDVTGGTGTVAASAVANVAVSCTTKTFTIGGTITGLAGSLVLQDNGGDNLFATTNGAFSFATSVASGDSYSVTIATQPSSPSQTCAISGGAGTVGSGNITGVTIVCATNSYAIGGTVTGLGGTGLILRDNGGDDLPISANGAFVFPTAVASQAGYAVTVATEPTLPSQTCTASNASGTVGGANVTSVAITCSTSAFAVSGTITGLTGTGLVLQDDGGDNLAIPATASAFTFATRLASGSPYNVAILTQPSNPSQTCQVSAGMGTVGASNVTGVAISCVANRYLVGGTVTGLAGSGLILRDNGGDDLPISATGSFAFATTLASGAAYAVTVATQPTAPSQTCTVASPSGTIGGANVTSVAISCTTNSFTISGTVSGLAGSGLVLQDNGGDNVAIAAGTSTFSFATKVASGATYSVTVLTQPSGPSQTCQVSAGMGTVAATNVTGVVISCAANQFTIGGTVNGYTGRGLVLEDNGGDDLAISNAGTFAFATTVASGGTYAVTVRTQPTQPTQTCTVAAGSGTVAGASVTSVVVTCTTNSYSIGGSVTGLAAGNAVVLQDNSADNLTISSNSTFTFPTSLPSGATYAVTVLTQPTSPAQTCTVTSGSGTIVSANVTNIAVACTTNTYAISGTVSGLAGSGLKLFDNGTDALAISANGTFQFATRLASGATYNVTVATQPTTPAQTCEVAMGSGTVAGANVTTVAVSCTTNTYSIGGTVSGLAGAGLSLQDNGADNLAVTANGSFTFATPVASGAVFAVTVMSQPSSPSQTCTVTGGSGTVAGQNIATVAIACTTNSYTIGGTISGLAGSGLKLFDNGTDALPINANGTFQFATKLASGQSYNVTAGIQPANPTQTCTVSMNAGTVAGANITSVAVACVTNTYTIGGTVSGLTGSGLVLQNNANGTIDNLPVSANGGFTFPTVVSSGGVFTVTVLVQPGSPSQTCTVAGSSGTVTSQNVSSVAVTCTTKTYSVGGTISGLVGVGLALKDNGGAPLTIPAGATTFTFATQIASGSTYSVTVGSQPAMPTQTCTASNASGTVASANVTSVIITCTTPKFSIGGTISGLSSTGLTLQDNGGDTLAVPANAVSFTFATTLASGSTYNVTVSAQPPGVQCAVASGSGTVPGGNVTSVVIRCGVVKLAAGYQTCGIGWDAGLYCWGANDFGGLGDGTTVSESVPTGPILSGAISVAAGENHACAVTAPLGRLSCWGYNAMGQLGDGTTVDKHAPVLLAGTGWSSVVSEAIGISTCALKTNKTLFCWGFTINGNVLVPTQVNNILSSTWNAVGVGGAHACGISADGSLWCWGQNSFGQLGNGGTTSNASPAPVGNGLNWVALGLGEFTTCAIKSDGTLWCWGFNNDGEVGDGTTTNRVAPVQVGTATTWSKVSGGARHQCGIQTDGSVWCWGANGSGQLGDNTTTGRLVPTRVTGVWSSVTTGVVDTCATALDGSPFCWGDGTAGDLGDGGSTNVSTPTPVIDFDVPPCDPGTC